MNTAKTESQIELVVVVVVVVAADAAAVVVVVEAMSPDHLGFHSFESLKGIAPQGDRVEGPLKVKNILF